MRRLVCAAAAALCAGALSGCSGVPFATLWHFRNFGPRNLVQTDPAQVRSAVRTWPGLDLTGNAPPLQVTLHFKGAPAQNFEMPMRRLTGKAAGRLPAPGTDREWYVFALTGAGVAAFRAMQRALAAQMNASGKFKQPGSLRLRVDLRDLQTSAAAKARLQVARTLPVEVRIGLSRKQGYYALYSGNLPVAKKAAGHG